MKQLLIGMLFSSGLVIRSFAGEGMWLPLLLDSLNHKDMQEKGLRLSPEEIYSINQASLKDAVVIFGGGCTGELISPEGLLITNHHCGYSRVQAHSTVENDYLTNGYWAGSREEELPNPGLSVTFLIRMKNVTPEILSGVPDSLPEKQREQLVNANIARVRSEATRGTHYQAEIKPFYFGKEYYLFIYERFNDVRLVGAPPEAIGRFGGDTDNWIWPRHTGDFTLFRIYAGKDNKPADYSPDNVPYVPKKYLNISMNGVKEGDFTMILGYPGRTEQYLTSDALDMIARKALPAKIEMRTSRLDALSELMATGKEARLRYASKYVGISNAWKKWIGVTKGVERANAVEKKQNLEHRFSQWARDLSPDTAGFSALMHDLDTYYEMYEPLYLAYDLGGELLNSIELLRFIHQVQKKVSALHDSSAQARQAILNEIRETGKSFFRSGAMEIDRKTLPALLNIYAGAVDERFYPDFYSTITGEFRNDYQAYVSNVFSESIYTDSSRFERTFSKPEKYIRKKLENDPLIGLYGDFSTTMITDVYPDYDSLSHQINQAYRKYITGLMCMNPSRMMYPDANFTMRLTYGKVEGYEPADAVTYDCFSTIDGIIEKEDPDVPDYQVPDQLKTLYARHDFGPYGTNGTLPVCFIASNHTSGGNSGSPVLDAQGNLIGINFDRNWEGTVSDYAYNPDICRNISLDIRYVLFIIDKVADADWLLNELTLVKQ